MADSTLVALKGLIARLRGYSALTSLVTSTKIVSSVLQQQSFPYVLVELESRDWSQDDDANMQHTVRVHAFSDEISPVNTMQIMQEVYNALNRQEANISVDSGIVVLCIFSGLKDTFKEPDGSVWHGVIEFTLIID